MVSKAQKHVIQADETSQSTGEGVGRVAAGRGARSQSFVAQSETGERRVDVLELVDFLKVYGLRPERFIQQIPPADE